MYTTGLYITIIQMKIHSFFVLDMTLYNELQEIQDVITMRVPNQLVLADFQRVCFVLHVFPLQFLIMQPIVCTFGIDAAKAAMGLSQTFNLNGLRLWLLF